MAIGNGIKVVKYFYGIFDLAIVQARQARQGIEVKAFCFKQVLTNGNKVSFMERERWL